MLSASGGFAPDPLTRGSAPGPRWGSAPDPVIGSRSALATPKLKFWIRQCADAQVNYTASQTPQCGGGAKG